MNFMPAARIGGAKDHTLKVWPEHIRIADTGRIRAQVSHVENLGSDTNVMVDAGDMQMITIRLFGQHEIATDSEAHLNFDDADCFVFDAAGNRAAWPKGLNSVCKC